MTEVDLGPAPLAGIAAVSVVLTLLAMIVIRKLADGAALRAARSQAQAHFLEIRLFGDEPAQVFRSQWALFRDQLRIFRLLAVPVLVISVVMFPALWAVDDLYSRAPLHVGDVAVVSVPDRASTLTVPDGVVVDSRPVFVRADTETNWRIRPTRALAGTVRSGNYEAPVVSGAGTVFLPSSVINRRSLEIDYPRAVIVGFRWWVWFGLFSLVSALVLRKPLGVPL